jgi:hypothetical protein
MFVFDRSFWTVTAGLATALGVVVLGLILDRGGDPSRPVWVRESPSTFDEAGRQPAAAAPRNPSSVTDLGPALDIRSGAGPEGHDISLAKR